MSARILIADDDAAIRDLLRRLLEGHHQWQVCGEAIDGRDAVTKASQLKPDVGLLDLAMPRLNGLEAAREISAIHPQMRMLLLTVQQITDELVDAARSVGFQGAVSKVTGAEVVQGVEVLLRDEPFFCIEQRPSTRFEP